MRYEKAINFLDTLIGDTGTLVISYDWNSETWMLTSSDNYGYVKEIKQSFITDDLISFLEYCYDKIH